jgi:6-pyruvoyltetrahydropterin/6-carboxytetrahydropterin synthase
MKIAKEFRWEMGHRLPFHKGLCKNIHGHSYKMIVEISGNMDKNGMIIDFFDLGKIIKPMIDKYDHSFLCWENDKVVKPFLIKNRMKRVIINYHSTVENICAEFSLHIFNKLRRINKGRFKKLTVKIFETPNAYAEISREFPPHKSAKGLVL